jgi:hypothetical protein
MNVHFSPRFVSNQQSPQLVATFGSLVNLDCATSENPRRDVIQWFFTPQQHETVPPQKIIHNSENYSPQVLEQGLFECLVSNKIGSVRREFNISLVPRGMRADLACVN